MRFKSALLQKTAALPEFLYHGTTASAVEEILREGVHAPSYWSTEPVAHGFAELNEEPGVVLRVPTQRFVVRNLTKVKRLLPGNIPHNTKDIRVWVYGGQSVRVLPADVTPIKADT